MTMACCLLRKRNIGMLIGIVMICVSVLALFALSGCGSGADSQSDKGQATEQQASLPEDEMGEKTADPAVASRVQAKVGESHDAACAQAAAFASDADAITGPSCTIAPENADFAQDGSAFVVYLKVTNTGTDEVALSSLCTLTARQSYSRANPTGTYVLGAFTGKDKSGQAVPSEDVLLAAGESAVLAVGWNLAEGSFLSVECNFGEGVAAQYLTFDI